MTSVLRKGHGLGVTCDPSILYPQLTASGFKMGPSITGEVIRPIYNVMLVRDFAQTT